MPCLLFFNLRQSPAQTIVTILTVKKLCQFINAHVNLRWSVITTAVRFFVGIFT